MSYLSILVFFTLIISLYFISRQAINNIYSFLSLFIKKDKVIFLIVSLIYFPGTVIHEMAHFFMATILFLKVKDIRLFPKIQGNDIKLGSVSFEKQDFLRGILVGIAPFIFAFLIFYSISALNLFPSNTLIINTIFIYLIFTISSTMFSSKKDLVDLIYIIPLLIIIFGVFYFLNININFIFNSQFFIKTILNVIETLNFYLFYSLIINLIILLSARLIILLYKK